MRELQIVVIDDVPGWMRPNGTFMPVIAGAEDTNDDDTDDDDSNDDADNDDNDDDKDDSDDGRSSDEEIEAVKDKAKRIKVLEDQIERRKKREKRKDKRLSTMEAELKELQKKNTPDDEQVQQERKELEERAREAEGKYERLRSENALLRHPEVAALPANRQKTVIRTLIDDVEWDDDENNVDDLVEDEMKSDPVLFEKPKGKDKDDDDDKGGNSSGGTASGKPVGSKKKKDKNAIDEAQIRNRFSHLKKQAG